MTRRSEDLAQRTHRRMLAVVAVLVVATVAGMVLLWPSSSELPATDQAPDALIDGVIVGVERYQAEPDAEVGGSGEMARVSVEVRDGPEAGQTVEIDTPTDGYPDFETGDRVSLSRSEVPDAEQPTYAITDFQRLPAILWLLGLFLVAVIAIGRWQGVRSLVALGLSLVVVVEFIVPGILTGTSPAAVALVGSVAVMLLSLYLTHGVDEMTTTAALGTTAALAITIALGFVFIEQGQLTGFSSEEASMARFTVEGLDLQGLVLAGLIIAALGVLDDVTVSQASTVFALHDTDPRLGWASLFSRAMKVGRDHTASVVNTLFLAYTGASLALLVLFSTGGLPLLEILNSEILATEIIKTVVGSLGLIAAVPLTTALAATVAVRRPPPPRTDGHADPAPVEPRDTRPRRSRRRARDAEDDSWLRYLREGSPGHDTPTDPEDEGRS